MNVRKVWTCRYIGTHFAAPKEIQVPSENSTGRPTGREITAVLKQMGFTDGLAEAISNGGSNLCWECR